MISRRLLILGAMLVCAGVGVPSGQAAVTLAVSGESRAVVHTGGEPGELTQLASQELIDYVRKLSGAGLRTVGSDETSKGGDAWVLLGVVRKDSGIREALEANGGVGADLKSEGFLLRTGSWRDHPVVIVAGADDAGVLYGIYELLGRLGITFRLTGDLVPDRSGELIVPDLDMRMEPALKRRGFLFPVNFDNASSYSWEDYETMLNQMARMKANYLQFWWFSFQPWVAYDYNGEPALFGDLARKESGFQSWAYGGFGSRTVDDVTVGKEHFRNRPRLAPREMQKIETPEEAVRTSQELLQRLIAHAAKRNIKVWLVIEMASLPPNLARHAQTVGAQPFDSLFGTFVHPLDPVNRDIQVNRLQAVAKAYPGAEGVFLNFAELYPDLKTGQHKKFFDEKRPEFYDLRQLSLPWLTALGSIYGVRVEQAVDATIADFSLFEHLMQRRDELLPNMKLGLMTVGRAYGLPFLHKRLPENVPFASLESSGVWTMLGMPMEYFRDMGERERIVQPRVDDDFDMLGMQCSVRQYGEKDRIFVDGVKHGLTGVAGQVERARGTEFNSSYLMEAAWESSLTPEVFYARAAERMFGREAAGAMKRALLKLEENQQYLGYYNFDGGYGTLPCCGANREVWAAYRYYMQKNPFAGPNTAAWTNLMTITPETLSRREGSIKLLNEAVQLMREASETAAVQGRSELAYMINRTEVLRDTFAALNSLRRAMLVFEDAFRVKKEVDQEKFVAQLETGLSSARDAHGELLAATLKFSERVDHVSDLAVLYHMNVRLLTGVQYGIQHLENVVNFHRGKPYLAPVGYEAMFPHRPDRGD